MAEGAVSLSPMPSGATGYRSLPVEPDVLEAPAVVDAVGHDRQVLEVRLAADCDVIVEEDRTGVVFNQFPLDLPHQLLALIDVGLGRLLINQLVNLWIAVAV